MQGLRSRAGIVAMTAGAFALLSVPVIAFGKGPPEVKGGGNDTAATVAAPEANVPDPPPGQAKEPAPPAPKAAPPGQAKPKPTPPGHAKRQAAAPSPAPGNGPDGSGPPGHSAGKPKPQPRGHAYGHSKHRPSSAPADDSSDPGSAPGQPNGTGSPDEPSRSPSGSPGGPDSSDEPDVTGGIDLPSADDVTSGDGGVPAAVAGDTVELPEDASPETLPFTGFGLAFIALGGLAAFAGGLMLRRSATP
jgi:outer membrane biosynthesis protein TonB